MMLIYGGKVILVKCTSGIMMELVQHGYQYLKVQQVYRVHKVHKVLLVYKVIKDK